MLSSENFIDAKIATKFADFNIRVYPNKNSNETVVLWTDKLDVSKPVLVRVHSECLTGDLLGSLHCDCGKQLAKALHMIGEEGGVLIYLRQEGRGIGLFEKMKTYQLQAKGYDTFRANTALGHLPDPRSYEMVKVILDDLHINKIRLITNNPSKISEIAKNGIEVLERVPLVSKPTKHNKAYLNTKKKMFNHFSGERGDFYYYQFTTDDVYQIRLLEKWVKSKKNDPFLKFGVAISANNTSLTNPSEINRIGSVIEACNDLPDFSPSIHFSFLKSEDILRDVLEIKKLWPSVKRLQLNDLPEFEMSTLERIFTMFSVEFPISDENFDLIYNVRFRKCISKNKSLVMLDNSKGKGIIESKNSFSRKIETLLAFGLNNICLCGGFGPDMLDTYFELRRYYKINFSIDAETNLKTDGKVDVEKVKTYLRQLIRFDDPNLLGIEQTRKFLHQHRRKEWQTTKICNTRFSIHPNVFHAGYFPSTGWFAQELSELVSHDLKFCEVGCGSGIISCLVAQSNPKLEVTATDINPDAAENTKWNAEQLGLQARVAVHTGDVLDSLNPTQRFDSIFWALPFGFLDPGVRLSFEEAQVFDPGYRAIRKFFNTAKNHLNPGGKILLGFSSDLGNLSLLEELAGESSIELRKVREKIMKEEEEIRFEIFEGKII